MKHQTSFWWFMPYFSNHLGLFVPHPFFISTETSHSFWSAPSTQNSIHNQWIKILNNPFKLRCTSKYRRKDLLQLPFHRDFNQITQGESQILKVQSQSLPAVHQLQEQLHWENLMKSALLRGTMITKISLVIPIPWKFSYNLHATDSTWLPLFINSICPNAD